MRICNCHATRIDVVMLLSRWKAGVVTLVGEMSIGYPAGTSVLGLGHSVRLADLSERTFAAPTSFRDVYEGEAAITKLKDMGLEPPEDMDWEKGTNHESSQP